MFVNDMLCKKKFTDTCFSGNSVTGNIFFIPRSTD